MSTVQDLVLARFLTLYGEPKTDNLEAFIAEYEAALKGMSREVLAGGADRVIRAQEFRSWPTPGECVKACHAAADHLALQKRRETPAELDARERVWPQPSEEQRARVQQIVDETKRAITTGGTWTPPGRGLSETSRRMTGEASSNTGE